MDTRTIELFDVLLHVEYVLAQRDGRVDIHNIRVVNDVGQPCGPDLRPLLADLETTDGTPLRGLVAFLLGGKSDH
jgi:hypothetical protein